MFSSRLSFEAPSSIICYSKRYIMCHRSKQWLSNIRQKSGFPVEQTGRGGPLAFIYFFIKTNCVQLLKTSNELGRINPRQRVWSYFIHKCPPPPTCPFPVPHLSRDGVTVASAAWPMGAGDQPCTCTCVDQHHLAWVTHVDTCKWDRYWPIRDKMRC